MVFQSTPTPAFGLADLSNCEREQIHLAGSIQPYGALLVVSEPDNVIVQASENAAAFLGLPGEMLGKSIDDLDADLGQRIRPHLASPLHSIPMAVRCQLGTPPVKFDCLLHRPVDGGLVIELERAGPGVDLTGKVDSALQTIVVSSSLKQLCGETAQVFKELTGYDRVMVYRFDDQGHGEIYSEEKQPELEPYLGNRYPASDIPQIARRLYEKTRVRMLVDVDYTPVPLKPRLSPTTGEDLDMSLCFLRSMSPIHIQYLKNMGVGATLVVSLVVGGRLWGLIACHHYAPRFIHYEVRTVCELLAEACSTRIAALESFAQSQAEVSVRRLEQRIFEAISRDGDWKDALFDSSQPLLRAVEASGAALLFEDEIATAGDVPGTQDLRRIGDWLDGQSKGEVVATASMEKAEPSFGALRSVASGLLAVSVSSIPGEYLIWFRPERVRTVTWAGNPFKPVVIGDDPSDLSPRRSFAQWHQLVEGTSEPWTPADLAAARLIGESLSDIVLQFRSVRMLLVQDQLAMVSKQVRISDQPVLIANAAGRILLTNEPFQRLLRSAHPHVEMIADLAPFFSDPAEVRDNLERVLDQGRSWRGEVRIEDELGEARALLARADPVLASPGRPLGIVVMFTDLTKRKAAEAARRRFQEGIIEDHRVADLKLNSKADLLYRNLFSSVVGNAQLAALEITDNLDLSSVPGLLESVRTSVTRTSELLEHLIWHASRSSEDDS